MAATKQYWVLQPEEIEVAEPFQFLVCSIGTEFEKKKNNNRNPAPVVSNGQVFLSRLPVSE